MHSITDGLHVCGIVKDFLVYDVDDDDATDKVSSSDAGGLKRSLCWDDIGEIGGGEPNGEEPSGREASGGEARRGGATYNVKADTQ